MHSIIWERLLWDQLLKVQLSFSRNKNQNNFGRSKKLNGKDEQLNLIWKLETLITQTNGKLFYAKGFEESILLKFPYYPNQSTNLIKSLSKYQQHFHRTRANNNKIIMEPQWPFPIAKSNEKEQSSRYHKLYYISIYVLYFKI